MDVDNKISRYVLPFVTLAEVGTGAWAVDKFLGSAFLIGHEGHALTAAHVIPGDTAASPLAVLAVSADAARWEVEAVTHVERHPRDDIAVLFTRAARSSFLQVSTNPVASSAQYMQFSYPADAAHELVQDGRTSFRPDLIYTAGYVRRRMTDIPVPGVRGSRLYELSTLAGPGASGSPVIHVQRVNAPMPTWSVFGVYVGERVSTAEGQLAFVSYAARTDALTDWRPELLGGRTLAELAAPASVPPRPRR
jgi:hypothetical protein